MFRAGFLLAILAATLVAGCSATPPRQELDAGTGNSDTPRIEIEALSPTEFLPPQYFDFRLQAHGFGDATVWVTVTTDQPSSGVLEFTGSDGSSWEGRIGFGVVGNWTLHAAATAGEETASATVAVVVQRPPPPLDLFVHVGTVCVACSISIFEPLHVKGCLMTDANESARDCVTLPVDAAWVGPMIHFASPGDPTVALLPDCSSTTPVRTSDHDGDESTFLTEDVKCLMLWNRDDAGDIHVWIDAPDWVGFTGNSGQVAGASATTA